MVLAAGFSSEEWGTLTPEERIRRCRHFAQEARTFAATALPHVADDYTQLAEKWLTLANEMERVLKEEQARKRSARR